MIKSSLSSRYSTIYGVVIFYFCFITIVNAQNGYKTTFDQGIGQPNVAKVCIEVDGKYIFGGDFYDQSIGRWTGFFAHADSNGNISLIRTEKVDTIIGFNKSIKMVSDSAGLYMVGTYGTDKILHYNFELDSTYVVARFDLYEYDLSCFGLAIDKDHNFVMSGISVLGVDTDYRVIKFRDSLLYTFRDVDTTVNSNCSRPLISKNDKVFLVGHDQSKNWNLNGTSYIVCLDAELNKLFSTKNTVHEISLSYSSGSMLDSDGNILFAGYDKYPNGFDVHHVAKVVKTDSNGHLLWNVEAGKSSTNNYYGWGSWLNIIESHERDGYILVGGHFTGSYNGDQEISDGAITKISKDGGTLWSKTYTFRHGTNRVYCVLKDVIATTDGGYFAVGESFDVSVPTNQLPDPPGRKSIILKTDSKGNIFPDTTSRNDALMGDGAYFLNLYPNPANNQIYISQVGFSPVFVMIHDMNGILMDEFECRDSDHNIILQTSLWESGTYYASWYRDNLKLGSKPFLVIH